MIRKGKSKGAISVRSQRKKLDRKQPLPDRKGTLASQKGANSRSPSSLSSNSPRKSISERGAMINATASHRNKGIQVRARTSRRGRGANQPTRISQIPMPILKIIQAPRSPPVRIKGLSHPLGLARNLGERT